MRERPKNTNTERAPTKRANETTANGEQPEPTANANRRRGHAKPPRARNDEAGQMAKMQPTPMSRPLQGALASTDWVGHPPAGSSFADNDLSPLMGSRMSRGLPSPFKSTDSRPTADRAPFNAGIEPTIRKNETAETHHDKWRVKAGGFAPRRNFFLDWRNYFFSPASRSPFCL